MIYKSNIYDSDSTPDENYARTDDQGRDLFIRSCGIVSELYTTILRKILSCTVPPADSGDVARKIRHISAEEWKTAMRVANRGSYDDCDFNLVYLFIVQSCDPRDQPTKGFGNDPGESDKSIGDYIERMRKAKEFVIAQNHLKLIEDEKYKELTNEALKICQRMDTINPAFVSSFYVDLLKLIETQPLDDSIESGCTSDIERMAEKEADMLTGKEHFAKLCKIVLELNPLILQTILQAQLPCSECVNEAPKLKNLKQAQIDFIKKDVPVHGYKNCDTSLM